MCSMKSIQKYMRNIWLGLDIWSHNFRSIVYAKPWWHICIYGLESKAYRLLWANTVHLPSLFDCYCFGISSLDNYADLQSIPGLKSEAIKLNFATNYECSGRLYMYRECACKVMQNQQSNGFKWQQHRFNATFDSFCSVTLLL